METTFSIDTTAGKHTALALAVLDPGSQREGLLHHGPGAILGTLICQYAPHPPGCPPTTAGLS